MKLKSSLSKHSVLHVYTISYNALEAGLKALKDKIFRNKTTIILVAIGFFGGLLWFTAIRFFLVQPEETHFHANFAVFINGEREDFSESTYYEEVAACTAEYENNPKGRVHMHDQINDVIHVHDKRVTYGHFFQNIGWAVSADVLATINNVYQESDTAKLTYMLNGEKVDRIDNKMISSLDKLLVSYGPNDDVESQYATIGNSAEEKNKYQDPSSCSGLNGAGHDSFMNKLKRATFWE